MYKKIKLNLVKLGDEIIIPAIINNDKQEFIVIKEGDNGYRWTIKKRGNSITKEVDDFETCLEISIEILKKAYAMYEYCWNVNKITKNAKNLASDAQIRFINNLTKKEYKDTLTKNEANIIIKYLNLR